MQAIDVNFNILRHQASGPPSLPSDKVRDKMSKGCLGEQSDQKIRSVHRALRTLASADEMGRFRGECFSDLPLSPPGFGKV